MDDPRSNFIFQALNPRMVYDPVDLADAFRYIELMDDFMYSMLPPEKYYQNKEGLWKNYGEILNMGRENLKRELRELEDNLGINTKLPTDEELEEMGKSYDEIFEGLLE